MRKQRRRNKVLSILLAAALCLSLLPTVALAAGTTHTVTSQTEFENALRDANEGDTIFISGSVMLMENSQDALVIDKSVTITGGSLIVRYSGILLGADVTFQDITLQFPSRSRNAIMANGYTLTLKNVARDASGQQIHLFCGGMTGHTQTNLPTQGEHGKIIIQGNTNLGNIYAGSISSDGKPNSFDKPATITIDSSATGSMGNIYASGALETPAGDNWFDFTEVAPPTPSVTAPRDYLVTGGVTIQLSENLVRQVDGTTGGSRNAVVEFNSSRSLTENVVLANIAGLSIKSGYLVPGAGSSFSGTDASVSVPYTTTLGLNYFDSAPVVGNFTGGGDLLLAEDQTLTITGTVSGSTIVGIGDINSGTNQSSGIVVAGHPYILAANSAEGDFELAPPNNNPSLGLAYDPVYGTWTTASSGTDQILVERFALASATVRDNESFVELPLNPSFATNSAMLSYMDFIPLEITVNGVTAVREEDPYMPDYYFYTVDGLSIEVINDALLIETSGSYDISDSYDITVTIPGEYTASGEDLKSSATLTVAGAGDTIEIPVPQANTGLRYTGREQVGVPAGMGYDITDNTGIDRNEYTATATLSNPYDSQWSDGTTDSKGITWSIEKAAGPAAPTGLGAAAPSIPGGSDGKIIGTTAQMEYAVNSDFTDAMTCKAGETTGLTAGTYYVRVIVSDTANYEVGASAIVVIPDTLTSSSIAVNSTAHKTAYVVGDALDMAGLTIEVTRSDGSTRTVAVTEDMVSGFDSSKAGGQILTITYDGLTTTYEVTVEDAVAAVYTVEVMDSYAPTSGAGSYSAGAAVQISAGQRPGYTFSGWTSTDGVDFADASSATTTFSMPNKAVVVTATWKSTDSAPQSTAYTVRFEPNGGTGTTYTVSDISGSYTLPAYTVCGFEAPANQRFKAWASGSENGQQFAAGDSYSISTDTVFYAIWEAATPPAARQYTIGVSASPTAGGTVSGGGTFAKNAFVTVTASANSGYRFVKWMENKSEVSTDASYTFTATADRTLIAVFEETIASETTKIVQTALTEVPEGLKNTPFNTVDKIKNELIRILTASPVYAAADTAVYDVKLQISTDGGKTWADATEANFPTSGITVIIPYPSGTGKTTHDFAVTHMFTMTSERLGTVAGQTEQPVVTKTDEGIEVTLKGLSPVGVAWQAISGSSTDDDGGDSSAIGATSGEVQQTNSPKAGNSFHIVLWLFLFCIFAGAIAALLIFKRHEKEENSR